MEKRLRKNKLLKRLHPTQVIISSFLLLIVIGALLLSLPAATKSDHSISFLDAAFTSTSAVCVTGLIVVDTSTAFTLFGQIVILTLLQIGGLGFMTIASFVLILVGRRITLSERMIIKESLNEFSLSGLVRMIRKILLVTFATELLGALLLAIRFVPQFGGRGVYFSIFHSISAFCNAGFDVFGQISGEYSSISMFAGDALVNLTMIGLIIVGGLGFVVVTDVFSIKRVRQKQKLSRYTKFVLIITAVLIGLGLAVVFPLEINNPGTLGADNLNTGGKILGGVFQAITPRTAGFATIDQSSLMPATKFITMLLMFIGASPAGTGGGIKTTTIAIVAIFALSGITGKKDAQLMDRRIAMETLKRAITITTLGIVFVFTMFFALLAIEGGRGGLFTFENIFFEAFSAFGTVGLSSGITPLLSAASKLLIMVSMFAGRVGLMSLTFALANRANGSGAKLRYPEERFMVG